MKIAISNRVFWAGVILAASALLGRNIGQTAPPIVNEVKARRIVVVDNSGEPVVTLGSPEKSFGLVRVGQESDKGYVQLLYSPKSGPLISIVGNDKSARRIGSKEGQDTYTKLSP